jgi:hypothetical protein
MEKMIKSAILGGFFTAHAISTLADVKGSSFTPILAYVDNDGETGMMRIVYPNPDVEHAVQNIIEEHKHDWIQATFIYDAYITLGDTKYDSILTDIYDINDLGNKIIIANPYIPKKTFSAFKVFKPKVVEIPEKYQNETQNDIIQAFFQGAVNNEPSNRIWVEHLDESI